MPTLVVIENQILDAMLADATTRAEFAACLEPLARAPAAKKRCGSCSRGAGKDASAYNDAKACLAQMTDLRRVRLKELLRAEQVRVVAAVGGKTRTFTF